jgi:hypothetical protein
MANYSCFDGDPEDLAVIVAFDPGGTTGYCVMGVPPEALIASSGLRDALCYIDYGQIDCGTRHGQTGVGMKRGHDGLNISGETDGIVRMMNIWDSFDYCAVVLEDFVLDVGKANMGRDLLTPVRIIAGFSTLMQYSYGPEVMESIFIQNRSLAKTTCTDDRLKNWNLYDGSSGAHARDATRHAYYFLRDCSGGNDDSRVKRHLAWPHLFDDPEVRPKVPKSKAQPGQRVWGLG